jgi:hypothetical protein
MTETIQISPAHRALIDKMKEIEKEKYKYGDAFARALGIDPGHLSRVKAGKVPVGLKVFQALWARHPETEYLIRNYMASEKGGKHA